MEPQAWLVTGCFNGFGAGFVHHQQRTLGDNVIATGRRANTKSTQLKDSGASAFEQDVTASEDVITAKVEEARGIYPCDIDIVVNNALATF